MLWANDFLGWDLTTRGVEIYLARVCISSVLLTSDKDTLVFLPLWFENESSWYLKLPLEYALVSALGMNDNNYSEKLGMKGVESPSVLWKWAS